MVGDEWTPGMHVPFDPVAAKRAQDLGVKVVVLNGKDLDNVSKYFNGEDFTGTVVE